jgi:HlyD family secretion protein
MMRGAASALSVVIVIALMVVSFAAGLATGTRPSPAPTTSSTPRPTRPPTPSPAPGIIAAATVIPRRSAEVAAPITALVESVLVDEQDQVGSGQLLMLLDQSTRRATLDVAEADLARATAAADRAETALAQLPDDATVAQLDAAEADVRLAEAELELARRALTAAQVALRQTEVRSPFGGTVAYIAVNEGEQAIAGQSVVTIADFGAWYVQTTDVSELDVVRIATGDQAIITFEALPGLELAGVVEQVRVRGTSDATGVSFDVLVRPRVHHSELRWNMTASVRILPSD